MVEPKVGQRWKLRRSGDEFKITSVKFLGPNPWYQVECVKIGDEFRLGQNGQTAMRDLSAWEFIPTEVVEEYV